jgi:O-methyltransferase
MKNLLKAIIPYGLLQLYSKVYSKEKPREPNPPWNPEGKPNPMHLWEDDENFDALYQQVRVISLCGVERLFMLYQFVKQTCSLEGDVAEVGVYKGGSAKVILEALGENKKIVHLCDTFEGFPAAKVDATKDWNVAGGSAASFEEVKAYLASYQNCRLYRGIFPETAEPIASRKFCFVHIDADLYQSVKDSCEFFYPRMVKGGIIIFDDYGFWAERGAKMAVDEFSIDKSEYPCYLQSGQCFIIKL